VIDDNCADASNGCALSCNSTYLSVVAEPADLYAYDAICYRYTGDIGTCQQVELMHITMPDHTVLAGSI
jgi:hypothetical protein